MISSMELKEEQAMLNGVVLNEKPQQSILNRIENAKDGNISSTTISENDISSPKGKKYCKITVPVEKDKETYLYFKILNTKERLKLMIIIRRKERNKQYSCQ